MNSCLETIGYVLARARQCMVSPRAEILHVLPTEFSVWRCRDVPGWKVDEIVALADYLFENQLSSKRLSGPAIWRMENGTGEYSLKALLQYAYILNLPALPLGELGEIDGEA